MARGARSARGKTVRSRQCPPFEALIIRSGVGGYLLLVVIITIIVDSSPKKMGAWTMSDSEQADLTTLTVQLLSAYVANNSVANDDLAGLIRSTKAALSQSGPSEPAAPEAPAHVPAVSIRKSLASKDHIVSLIDGKPYKTLKRHLTTHGLTPADYRARYDLPASYPMVAPNYSEQRRIVAQQIGLGSRLSAARKAAPEPVDAPAESAPAKAAPAKAKAASRPRAKARATEAPAVTNGAAAPQKAPRAKAAKPAGTSKAGRKRKAPEAAAAE
jgi:predicted transcriptional regulator